MDKEPIRSVLHFDSRVFSVTESAQDDVQRMDVKSYKLIWQYDQKARVPSAPIVLNPYQGAWPK